MAGYTFACYSLIWREVECLGLIVGSWPWNTLLISWFFCVRPAVLLTTMSPSDFYTKDRKSGVIDVIKASEQ